MGKSPAGKRPSAGENVKPKFQIWMIKKGLNKSPKLISSLNSTAFSDFKYLYFYPTKFSRMGYTTSKSDQIFWLSNKKSQNVDSCTVYIHQNWLIKKNWLSYFQQNPRCGDAIQWLLCSEIVLVHFSALLKRFSFNFSEPNLVMSILTTFILTGKSTFRETQFSLSRQYYLISLKD